MKPEVLAIIPARGGSKRFEGKNLALLAGRPLIAHTIQHALQAKRVHRVVVSTDSTEIADVASRWGAEVVFRPEEISGDMAQSELALIHTLDFLETREGYTPEIVVFLQCTSPIRRPVDIDDAVGQFLKQGADSLFSVVEWRGFLWEQTEDGIRPLSYSPGQRSRSQHLHPFLKENGSIYVVRRIPFLKEKNRLFGKIIPYLMNPLSTVDIDVRSDLELAELYLRWAEIDDSEDE